MLADICYKAATYPDLLKAWLQTQCKLVSAARRFTCARWPIQENTLGRLNAKALKPFFVGDRQHYSFHQLLDLLIKASNITVIFCGLLIYLCQEQLMRYALICPMQHAALRATPKFCRQMRLLPQMHI